jgi:hypothetical protein
LGQIHSIEYSVEKRYYCGGHEREVCFSDPLMFLWLIEREMRQLTFVQVRL